MSIGHMPIGKSNWALPFSDAPGPGRIHEVRHDIAAEALADVALRCPLSMNSKRAIYVRPRLPRSARWKSPSTCKESKPLGLPGRNSCYIAELKPGGQCFGRWGRTLLLIPTR